jgi:hypothetical protein
MTEETSVRNKAKSIIIKKNSQKPGKIEEILRISEKNLNSDQVASGEFPLPRPALELFPTSSLEQHYEFRMLRDSLKNYLLDIQKPEQTLHLDKPDLWKQVLYSSLYKLLQECIYTLSSKQQYSYLIKIHEWYFNKLGQSIPKPPSASSQPVSFYPKVSLRSQEKPSSSSPASRKTFFPSVEDDLQTKLDSFFLESRTKELKEKRVRETMIAKIKGWVKERPRRSEEHARSFETARYASKIDKRAVLKDSATEERPKNFFDLSDFDAHSTAVTKEAEISKSFEVTPPASRISEIRRKNKRIFDYEGFNDEPRSVLDYDGEAVTLGVYSRGKVEVNRPQTSLLLEKRSKSNRLVKGRLNNLEEVAEVKKTLARNNILCCIETLKYGLLLSEDLPNDKLGASWIPPAGSGLLKYPVSQTPKTVKPKRHKK